MSAIRIPEQVLRRLNRLILLCAVPLLVQGAYAADAAAGKDVFKTQCALCHSAEAGDAGGAQGPPLAGVGGRKAAADARFNYSAPLKASNLTWDAATLDRFLAAPTTVVPGSAMVVPVPSPADRANLVAYLLSPAVNPRVQAAQLPVAPAATPAPRGTPEYLADMPGKRHSVRVEDLPKPYATEAARNFPRVAPAPPAADRKLQVPPGFKVEVFAEGLTGPRKMIIAPNGDVFVATTQAGKIRILRPARDGGRPEQNVFFAEGLSQPYGLAFHPAKKPRWLYVAETNRVVRYAYSKGDLKASGAPEVVVPQLSPVGGGHFSRDLVFSRDGSRFYVSVGSLGNIAEDLTRKTPAEIAGWEAEHGLGAAWDKETNRAGVLEFDTAKPVPGRMFATGIRNCVAMSVHPKSGDVWCTTNERDNLGDDLVPDYATRVKGGAFYGWPWYYLGAHEDPRQAGQRPDLAGKITVPDVLFTAHSAATSITFYNARHGSAAFPKEYRGDAFVSLHGSWNRGFRTGHKIVRIRLKDGVPTNEYEDFLTGFIVDNNTAWARPGGVAVASDGSLLVSDDGNNFIWRVSYSKP
jgi:glucose/arabinose dehydrogenase/cytochrome c2